MPVGPIDAADRDRVSCTTVRFTRVSEDAHQGLGFVIRVAGSWAASSGRAGSPRRSPGTEPTGRRRAGRHGPARRRGRVELRDAQGRVTGVVDSQPSTALRLARVNLVAAVSFVLGGSLFALGALLAQVGVGAGPDRRRRLPRRRRLLQPRGLRLGAAGRQRADRHRRERVAELARAGAGGSRGPTTSAGSARRCCSSAPCSSPSAWSRRSPRTSPSRQANSWIWLPDMLGCVCFLVSGHLALLEVCHGRIGCAPTRSAGGSSRSTRSGRCCSSWPGSRRSRGRPPRRRSTSGSSTGAPSRRRLLRHRRRRPGLRQARADGVTGAHRC